MKQNNNVNAENAMWLALAPFVTHKLNGVFLLNLQMST